MTEHIWPCSLPGWHQQLFKLHSSNGADQLFFVCVSVHMLQVFLTGRIKKKKAYSAKRKSSCSILPGPGNDEWHLWETFTNQHPESTHMHQICTVHLHFLPKNVLVCKANNLLNVKYSLMYMYVNSLNYNINTTLKLSSSLFPSPP